VKLWGHGSLYIRTSTQPRVLPSSRKTIEVEFDAVKPKPYRGIPAIRVGGAQMELHAPVARGAVSISSASSGHPGRNRMVAPC